eukprot:358612-Chlamydomonas_euryale.AAC.6
MCVCVGGGGRTLCPVNVTSAHEGKVPGVSDCSGFHAVVWSVGTTEPHPQWILRERDWPGPCVCGEDSFALLRHKPRSPRLRWAW